MGKFPDKRKKYFWKNITENEQEILEDSKSWVGFHYCEGWDTYVESDCNDRCMCGSTNLNSVFYAHTKERPL